MKKDNVQRQVPKFGVSQEDISDAIRRYREGDEEPLNNIIRNDIEPSIRVYANSKATYFGINVFDVYAEAIDNLDFCIRNYSEDKGNFENYFSSIIKYAASHVMSDYPRQEEYDDNIHFSEEIRCTLVDDYIAEEKDQEIKDVWELTNAGMHANQIAEKLGLKNATKVYNAKRRMLNHLKDYYKKNSL